MSNPPIPPALTEEEWSQAGCTRRYGSKLNEVFVVGMESTNGTDVYLSINDAGLGEGVGIDSAAYHGLAALCLYEQEYGFSYRDLHDLDICLLNREPIAGTHLARLKDLRNRIAALLPPQPE